MDGALALAVTAGGLVMLYGHGRLVAHWLLPDTRLEAGAVAALGLTALALPGGLLNLLGLSGPYSLWLLAATGLLAVLRWPPARGDLDLGTLAAISPVLLWVLVLASTAQPAVLLNFSDDFSNYLVRPLRLLQTGSVAGNPFSGLGMDSLGALSFLQAFVLSVLPVGFITVVDTLLGLLLAALLVDALGRRAGVSVAVRSGAVLALLLPTRRWDRIGELIWSMGMLSLASIPFCLLTPAIGDQREPDQDQEGQRQHLHRGML